MRNASKLIGVCGGLFALTTITGAPAPQQGQVQANGIIITYGSWSDGFKGCQPGRRKLLSGAFPRAEATEVAMWEAWG